MSVVITLAAQEYSGGLRWSADKMILMESDITSGNVDLVQYLSWATTHVDMPFIQAVGVEIEIQHQLLVDGNRLLLLPMYWTEPVDLEMVEVTLPAGTVLVAR